jgi:hypothetical protein
MKDMFDCLEENWNSEDIVFLSKTIKNKRRGKRKTLFLNQINEYEYPIWGIEPNIIFSLNPSSQFYEQIKKMVREKKISCQIYRVPISQFLIITSKPVKKETWWSRLKVWFSRKVQYFAGYISIERSMKD